MYNPFRKGAQLNMSFYLFLSKIIFYSKKYNMASQQGVSLL